MHVEGLSRQAVSFIAANMRDWDRKEIFATRRNDSVDQFVDDVLNAGEFSWVAGKSKPIAAFGGTSMWPGVWTLWFFATSDINEIGLSVTRLINSTIIPAVLNNGAHRLECKSIDGHDDAQRWLETLGAQREATLKGYGRDGEDFHVYAWRG